MSKKQDRAWFVCDAWADMVSRHYANDADAARALDANPKLLAKLRARTPVAKSGLLRLLRRYAARHDVTVPVASLVADIRSR